MVDSSRQFEVSGSSWITIEPAISKRVFKSLEKQKTALKASQNRQESPRKTIKRDFLTSRCLQYIQCENLDLEVPDVAISTQKPKKILGNKSGKNENCNISDDSKS